MSFTATRISGGKADLEVAFPAKGDTTGLNATPEADVTSFTAADDSALYSILIDCTDNPNEDITVRIYNATSATVGTDLAHAWFQGKRGRIVDFEFSAGIRFDAGMTVAAVKGAGGTAGAENPSGVVRVTLRLKENLTA